MCRSVYCLLGFTCCLLVAILTMMMVMLFAVRTSEEREIFAERAKIIKLLNEMKENQATYSDLTKNVTESVETESKPEVINNEPRLELDMKEGVDTLNLSKAIDSESLNEERKEEEVNGSDLKDKSDLFTYCAPGVYQRTDTIPDNGGDGPKVCTSDYSPYFVPVIKKSDESDGEVIYYGETALMLYQPNQSDRFKMALDKVFQSILKNLWGMQSMFENFPSVTELIEIGKKDISEEVDNVKNRNARRVLELEAKDDEDSSPMADEEIDYPFEDEDGEDRNTYDDYDMDPIAKQRLEMEKLREKIYAAAEKCLLVCKVLEGDDCVHQCGVGFEKTKKSTTEKNVKDDNHQQSSSWYQFFGDIKNVFCGSAFYKHIERYFVKNNNEVLSLIITVYRTVAWAIVYIVEVVWYFLNLMAKFTTMKMSLSIKTVTFVYHFVTVTVPRIVVLVRYNTIVAYHYVVFFCHLFVAICRDILALFK